MKRWISVLFAKLLVVALLAINVLIITQVAALAQPKCSSAYPDVCIPPPPPDLDCKDIKFRNFRVLPPDPHGFDSLPGGNRDKDGIGCEKK